MGAEYGLPATQIRACGGEVTVQVPKEVADRFNRALVSTLAIPHLLLAVNSSTSFITSSHIPCCVP